MSERRVLKVIVDEETFQAVKDGKFTGMSIGGRALVRDGNVETWEEFMGSDNLPDNLIDMRGQPLRIEDIEEGARHIRDHDSYQPHPDLVVPPYRGSDPESQPKPDRERIAELEQRCVKLEREIRWGIATTVIWGLVAVIYLVRWCAA